MKEKIKNIFKKTRSLKNPKDFLIFFFITIIFAGTVLANPAALGTRDGGWRVSTTTSKIDVWSNCQDVTKTNSAAKDVFVPTKTQAEWNAFIAGHPSSVSVSPCAASCVVTSWSPATSSRCSGINFTQTSNCGTYRIVGGTGNCGGGVMEHGVCDTTAYNCISGVSNPSFYQDWASQYRWRCDGTNGGNHSGICIQLSGGVDEDGACNVTAYDCVYGTSDPSAAPDTPAEYRWICRGIGNGLDSGVCSQARAVDGVCGGTAYNCNVGTSAYENYDPEPLFDNWTWRCLGENGGATSPLCTETEQTITCPLSECAPRLNGYVNMILCNNDLATCSSPADTICESAGSCSNGNWYCYKSNRVLASCQ